MGNIIFLLHTKEWNNLNFTSGVVIMQTEEPVK